MWQIEKQWCEISANTNQAHCRAFLQVESSLVKHQRLSGRRYLESFIGWLVSSGFAAALIVGIGLLFRESILKVVGERVALSSQKVLQERQHAFELQIKQVQLDFERLNSKQDQILSSVLDVSSDRAKEVSKREIEAAEAIWSSVGKLDELFAPAQIAEILKFDEIEAASSSDRKKFEELAEMLTKTFTPEFAKDLRCDWARLFVNESAWAFYSAYHSILMTGAIRLKTLAIGAPLTGPEINSGLKKAILEALPHQEPTFEKFPDVSSTIFLQEIKQALVIELRRSIQGEHSSSAEVKKSIAILDALAAKGGGDARYPVAAD